MENYTWRNPSRCPDRSGHLWGTHPDVQTYMSKLGRWSVRTDVVRSSDGCYAYYLGSCGILVWVGEGGTEHENHKILCDVRVTIGKYALIIFLELLYLGQKVCRVGECLFDHSNELEVGISSSCFFILGFQMGPERRSISDINVVGPQHRVQLSLDEAQGRQVHLVPFEEWLGKQHRIGYLSGGCALHRFGE